MVKTLSISLIFTFLISEAVYAQNMHADSLAATVKTDVKKFKLSREDQKKFRADRHNFSSDLFKPSTVYTTNSTLLNDSVYVKAFRHAAFKKASKRRTVGHYVLVGIGAYIVAFIITYFLIIVTLLGHGN